MSTQHSSGILASLSENQSKEISRLLLSSEVLPDEVRVDYHGACVLWLFGDRFSRFYDWTVLDIGIALESAIRTSLLNRGAKIAKEPRFKDLISMSLDKGLIDDSALHDSEYLREWLELHKFRQSFEYDLADIAAQIGEHYEAKTFGRLVADLLDGIRAVRNKLAHGTYVLPVTGTTITREVARHYLELSRSILLALFPSEGPPNKPLQPLTNR